MVVTLHERHFTSHSINNSILKILLYSQSGEFLSRSINPREQSQFGGASLVAIHRVH